MLLIIDYAAILPAYYAIRFAYRYAILVLLLRLPPLIFHATIRERCFITLSIIR